MKHYVQNYKWLLYVILTYKMILVVKVSQSCPTLCNAMDYSPPGSSVHGVL